MTNTHNVVWLAGTDIITFCQTPCERQGHGVTGERQDIETIQKCTSKMLLL